MSAKMGRPSVSPEKRRGVTPVRLNAGELARVEAAAKRKDKKLTTWMREILLENAPPID